MAFFHRGRLVLRSDAERALVFFLLLGIVSRIGLVAGASRPRLGAAFLLFGHSDLRKSSLTVSCAASGMPDEAGERTQWVCGLRAPRATIFRRDHGKNREE